MPSLLISRRAAADIDEIRQFSVGRWGLRVAEEYVDGIEEALNRLRENPSLLRVKRDFSNHSLFYRVARHFLVCSVIEDNVYLVTVKHGSLDLPNRLAELEPTLKEETDLLHKAFIASRARLRSGN
jgi:toxin ParE1/3/4